MATLAELIKGFRHNVRAGYPTTLLSTGAKIHLSCQHPRGFVGISDKPSITKKDEIGILFNAQQNEHLTRTAKLEADVAVMDALREIIAIYICYTGADQNLIKTLRHTVERINRPYIPRTYPPDESIIK